MRRVEPFHDHAVEVAADFIEPFLCFRQVGRRRRQANPTFRLEIFPGRLLVCGVRARQSRRAICRRSRADQNNEQRGMSRAGFGRGSRGMQTQLQVHRTNAPPTGMAVRRRAQNVSRRCLKLFDHVGKITPSGWPAFDCRKTFAIAKGEAAKAVPFRLVLPVVADRDFVAERLPSAGAAV